MTGGIHAGVNGGETHRGVVGSIFPALTFGSGWRMVLAGVHFLSVSCDGSLTGGSV